MRRPSTTSTRDPSATARTLATDVALAERHSMRVDAPSSGANGQARGAGASRHATPPATHATTAGARSPRSSRRPAIASAPPTAAATLAQRQIWKLGHDSRSGAPEPLLVG